MGYQHSWLLTKKQYQLRKFYWGHKPSASSETKCTQLRPKRKTDKSKLSLTFHLSPWQRSSVSLFVFAIRFHLARPLVIRLSSSLFFFGQWSIWEMGKLRLSPAHFPAAALFTFFSSFHIYICFTPCYSLNYYVIASKEAAGKTLGRPGKCIKSP